VTHVGALGDALGALGFTPTDVGTCRWRLAGRAHQARALSVVFGGEYLDFIEIGALGWRDILRSSPVYARGMAPSGVVLSCGSLDDARDALSARGLAGGSAYGIVRELAGADPARIDYEIFSLAAPFASLAVIRDGAPGALRRERWLRHPNGARGVRRVDLRVPSREVWGPVVSELDARLFVHEEPLDGYLGAVSRLLPRGERAALLCVEVEVADLDLARRRLETSGVPFQARGDAIEIRPEAGYGCGWVFAADAAA
jgi:hypothetical protein